MSNYKEKERKKTHLFLKMSPPQARTLQTAILYLLKK